MGVAGQGGFGTVRIAWDTRIQRKVAIKCIELNEDDAARARQDDIRARQDAACACPDAAQECQGVAMVYRNAARSHQEDASAEPDLEQHFLSNIPGLDEARTAAMLTDANIVTVYDFEVLDNVAYLIMEYVEGITLTRFLREFEDEISLDIATALFASVAHALEVAHAHQVLHLDIKPDNVLINRQGQVKVTDFGLATLADVSGCGYAGGGTIGYMPLEQMRQESLDARTDEWSLASLTYEMLTGENPFLAPNLARAETAITEAELVLPSLCWDDMDEGIDDVIFRALDPEVEERYDTVEQFADALEPYLGKAKAGHKALAVLVGEAQNEKDDETVEAAALRVPLAERISDRAAAVISRVFSVAGALLVSIVAAVNLPWVHSWGDPLLWGLVALCLLAAALKPHLGALLSFLFLGISTAICGAPAIGVVFVVLTCAWWWFAGRAGNRQACAAFAQPLFGAVGFAPVAPVMAGCFLGVRDALVNAAYSVACAFVMSGYGVGKTLALWNAHDALSAWSVSGALPNKFWYTQFPGVDLLGSLSTLGDLSAWCVALSWVIAAVVLSAFCLRGSRAADITGAVIACVCLVAGAFGAAWLASPLSNLLSYLPSALGAGALGVVFACMGICDRVRWEAEDASAAGTEERF